MQYGTFDRQHICKCCFYVVTTAQLYFTHCRGGYMFWTDVSLRIIAIARLNGTQSRILVNTGINTPGIYSSLLMLRTLVHIDSYQCSLHFGDTLHQNYDEEQCRRSHYNQVLDSMVLLILAMCPHIWVEHVILNLHIYYSSCWSHFITMSEIGSNV